MDLDAIEVRVLGCLLEKQRTTPDAYPLSLNALRLACNQSTNREPVVEYDERTIRDALQRLGRRRFARLASGHGSRAVKYRHLVDETLRIDAAEQSVLAVLMLRGAQTPGELRQRTERLHAFTDGAALQATLDRLIERGLVVRLPRRPGQKEERFAHRLSEDAEDGSGDAAVAPGGAGYAVSGPPPAPPAATAVERDGAEDRLRRLERRIDALGDEVAELREALARAERM